MDLTSFILAQSREAKIRLMTNALKEDKFGEFIGITKILLAAPITKGGIETEVIDDIFQAHLKEDKKDD